MGHFPDPFRLVQRVFESRYPLAPRPGWTVSEERTVFYHGKRWSCCPGSWEQIYGPGRENKQIIRSKTRQYTPADSPEGAPKGLPVEPDPGINRSHPLQRTTWNPQNIWDIENGRKNGVNSQGRVRVDAGGGSRTVS